MRNYTMQTSNDYTNAITSANSEHSMLNTIDLSKLQDLDDNKLFESISSRVFINKLINGGEISEEETNNK